jgi:hypothetical protein
MNERFQIGCLTGGVPLRFGSSSRFIGLRTIKIDKHLPSALVFAILIYLYLEIPGLHALRATPALYPPRPMPQ